MPKKELGGMAYPTFSADAFICGVEQRESLEASNKYYAVANTGEFGVFKVIGQIAITESSDIAEGVDYVGSALADILAAYEAGTAVSGSTPPFTPDETPTRPTGSKKATGSKRA